MKTMTDDRTRPVHPFHGARKAPPTERHHPVIWECMLGTVYAQSPDGVVRYFDYDWDAARAHAGVDPADPSQDLRLSRPSRARNGWSVWALPDGLRRGQVALWAVVPS